MSEDQLNSKTSNMVFVLLIPILLLTNAFSIHQSLKTEEQNQELRLEIASLEAALPDAPPYIANVKCVPNATGFTVTGDIFNPGITPVVLVRETLELTECVTAYQNHEVIRSTSPVGTFDLTVSLEDLAVISARDSLEFNFTFPAQLDPDSNEIWIHLPDRKPERFSSLDPIMLKIPVLGSWFYELRDGAKKIPLDKAAPMLGYPEIKVLGELECFARVDPLELKSLPILNK